MRYLYILIFPRHDTPQGWEVVINSATQSKLVAQNMLNDRRANGESFPGEKLATINYQF